MYRVKRVFTVILSLMLGFTVYNGALCAVSCAPITDVGELFYYRTGSVSADVALEYNGVSARFHYAGNASECAVEFCAPTELVGFTIEVTENGGRVSVDGLTAEAPDALCAVPGIMQAVFTLSPDEVTAIETAPHPDNADETVTKVTSDGITVALDADGTPLLAEGALFGMPFSAKITNFTAVTPER